MADVLASIFDRALRVYGQWLPNHPGKWRIFDWLAPRAEATWTHPRLARRRGVWFELNLRHFVPRYIFYLGFDLWETRFVETVVQPGWVIADVGANIGYYSLLFQRRVGPEGRVYAFEPSPENYRALERNIALNNATHVQPYQMGLADACGKASLVRERAGNPGRDRLAFAAGADSETVPVTTLDLFVEQQGLRRLDLIKVDIEGTEQRFLLGAAKTLARFRPILLIELNPSALGVYGATAEGVVRHLEDAGYRLYQSGWRGRRPLSQLPGPGQELNVVGLPEEKVPGRGVMRMKAQLSDGEARERRSIP